MFDIWGGFFCGFFPAGEGKSAGKGSAKVSGGATEHQQRVARAKSMGNISLPSLLQQKSPPKQGETGMIWARKKIKNYHLFYYFPALLFFFKGKRQLLERDHLGPTSFTQLLGYSQVGILRAWGGVS